MILRAIQERAFVSWGKYPDLNYSVMIGKLDYLNMTPGYDLSDTDLIKVAGEMDTILNDYMERYPPFSLVRFAPPI